jgi:hypothetical protein
MWWFTYVVYRNEDYRPLLLHMQCYIYTKCMYIWYHIVHNFCWNVKNILYSNFMIIYWLCKVLSFTWSMPLSSTIWFWILKTFSQQLNDKLPTWKYISTFFSTEQIKIQENMSSLYVLLLRNLGYHTFSQCTESTTPAHMSSSFFYWLRVA